MQMNLALNVDNKKQAEILRQKLFPNTDQSTIRDAYVFSKCIDGFSDDPNALLPFFNDDSPRVQRMITINQEANSRLRTIASALGKPLAATFRAIIAYSIAHMENKEKTETIGPLEAGVTQLLIEKVCLLQVQLESTYKTMNEIKLLLEMEDKNDLH